MENRLFRYYSEVEPQPVDWLWYPYLPYGKITLLQGDPGEGKSTFALQLAAILTKGAAPHCRSAGDNQGTVAHH